jgi:hypothetical protein
MKLDELMDLWERDSKIDKTDPSMEIIRIPVLHNHYNKHLTLHNLAVKRAILEIAALRRVKWMYYNGKMDEDELRKHGWEPFPFTLKSDLAVYMEGDEDMSKMMRKKAYHEEASNFCLNVMKELNSRTYQLRAYIDWERFVAGQH